MENSTQFKQFQRRTNFFRREKYMSANGNGHSAQPATTQPQIEHPLSDRERVAQYALAQAAMNQDWASNPRWTGIERPYTAEDVLRLRGSIHIEHTLARMGAEGLWCIRPRASRTCADASTMRCSAPTRCTTPRARWLRDRLGLLR